MVIKAIIFFLLYANVAFCTSCNLNTAYKGLNCNLNLSYKSLVNIKKLLNDDDKFVTLTFDDGPSSLSTVNAIINILEEYDAKATFFLLGERIDGKLYEAVRRIDEAGHEIGNHSWSHRKLTLLPYDEQFQELEDTSRVIQEITGKDVKWFRPPYGCHDTNVITYAKQLNMYSILWTVDSLDWRGDTAEVLVERIMNAVHNGAIILLHDHGYRSNTIEALPQIIMMLKKLGYKLVTLSEWEQRVCDACG